MQSHLPLYIHEEIKKKACMQEQDHSTRDNLISSSFLISCHQSYVRSTAELANKRKSAKLIMEVESPRNSSSGSDNSQTAQQSCI